MRRRLTIARALINDPELVILDEPTTGLDPQVRHMIWSRLRALKDQGKALLLTTHYMEEAERLCDQVVIMDNGRILEQDAPKNLIHQHIEKEVVEVQGDTRTIEQALHGLSHYRSERVGDGYYCYADDARPLIDRLESRPSLVYLHRPASLEDVFLKLTGRELKE
jgi:lipooligosaccharide transport system ATP-binding protein